MQQLTFFICSLKRTAVLKDSIFEEEEMNIVFLGTLVGLGLGGCFLSGLLGIGGEIIMISTLLYVPPLLVVGRFDAENIHF